MIHQLRIVVLIFAFFFPCKLQAQGSRIADNLQMPAPSAAVSKSSAMLYAHFDKNIYSINETLWFTAYLSDEDQHMKSPDFIQLLLVDHHRHIVLEQKFLMSEGLASGNFLLPDSLKSGRYKVILYTNTLLDGEPKSVFVQPVVIKGAADPAGATVVNTPKAANGAGLKKTLRIYPERGSNMPVISIKKGLAEDTLQVMVKSSRIEQFQVVVHDLHDVYFRLPFVVNQEGRSLKIALTDLPRGIAQIVLLDSAKRPCAKRLFYAHYNWHNKLNIKTKDSVYKKRQKVELTLQLSDWQNLPLSGIVSVSCFQSNRLSPVLATDIETYNFWHRTLDGAAVSSNLTGLRNGNSSDLEKLLMTSSWDTESWAKLLNDQEVAKSSVVHTLAVSGKVTRSGKRLKKPVTLIMLKDSSLSFIPTDSSGHFLLSNNALLQESRKSLHLMVSGKFPQEYEIKISDPYQKISKSLAEGIADQEHWESVVPENIDLGLSGSSPGNQLKEVKIVSRRDLSFYGSRKTENACCDYICKYGYLNCPMHGADPGNIAPVKGSRYKLYAGTSGDGTEIFSTLLYSGCEVKVYENTKIVKGIQPAVEFVPQDYNSESISLPELSSTLLWVNSCVISPAGVAQLTFYTNDLTGRFRIVVQGLAGDNVVTGEKIISVR